MVVVTLPYEGYFTYTDLFRCLASAGAYLATLVVVGCNKKAFKPSCDAIKVKYYQLFRGKGGEGFEEDCEEDKEEADEAPRPRLTEASRISAVRGSTFRDLSIGTLHHGASSRYYCVLPMVIKLPR